MLYSNTAIAQVEENCPRQIYDTGLFLGWGSALLEYTRSREAPSPFDRIIIEQLQGAYNSVERAARDCEPAIPAWPGWKQQQNYLLNQIKELQSTTNHKFKRGRVYTNINNTYYSWGSKLSIMVFDGQTINTPTCSTCYFRLGFSTAYAAQAFRQADEALNRNNDIKATKQQMKLAADYLRRTLKVLNTYKEIQQPRGSFIIRCANLSNLDLENRIASLIRLSNDYNNVTECIRLANLISEDIKAALSADRNVKTSNSYEYCRSKYCPECDNSIVLLGVAVDEDCQKCLDKNKDLISKCMNNSSVSSVDNNENHPNSIVIPRSVPTTTPTTIPTTVPTSDPTIVPNVSITSTQDINSLLSQADCSQWPNTEAKWDYSKKETYCDCIAGYQWNDDYSECLSKQELIVAQTDCSMYPNTQPVWDPVNNEVVCDCLPGFEWNENFTKCISKSQALMQNIDCSMYPNTQSVWDPVKQEAFCDCIPGYEWNAEYTACNKLVQQEIDQTNCSHLPNTRPLFDSSLNEWVCDCLPGFKWNKRQTACEPERKKPNINWDNVLTLTMGVLNAVNGNTQGIMPPGYGPGTTPTSMQQPEMHQSNCNDQQQAGKNVPEVHTIDLGQSFGTFQFDYQTFTEEDQIIITNGGRVIFNSGCVGESKSIQLQISGSPIITVRVNPNCDGGTNTAWNFTVHCPRNN